MYSVLIRFSQPIKSREKQNFAIAIFFLLWSNSFYSLQIALAHYSNTNQFVSMFKSRTMMTLFPKNQSFKVFINHKNTRAINFHPTTLPKGKVMFPGTFKSKVNVFSIQSKAFNALQQNNNELQSLQTFQICNRICEF